MRDWEEGWPCQRIRIGIGAALFFLFEITIGRQLPLWLTFSILGIGVAALVSARESLKSYRQKMQIEIIQDVLAHRSP